MVIPEQKAKNRAAYEKCAQKKREYALKYYYEHREELNKKRNAKNKAKREAAKAAAQEPEETMNDVTEQATTTITTTAKTVADVLADNVKEDRTYMFKLSGKDLKRLPEILSTDAELGKYQLAFDGANIKLVGMHEKSMNAITEAIRALGIDDAGIQEATPAIQLLVEEITKNAKVVDRTEARVIDPEEPTGKRRVVLPNGLIEWR